MSDHLIIALNREYGSGGKEIAEKLGKRLGIGPMMKISQILLKDGVVSARIILRKSMRNRQTASCICWR